MEEFDKKEIKQFLKKEAANLGCEFVDFEYTRVSAAHVQLIPRHVAEKHTAIIFNRIEDTLLLAMANPLNVFAIDEIQQITGLKVLPFLSEEEETKDAIKDAYKPG